MKKLFIVNVVGRGVKIFCFVVAMGIHLFLSWSCTPAQRISWPEGGTALGGSDFFRQAASMGWKSRDSLAVRAILDGNVPPFLKRFKRIRVSVADSISGQAIWAQYYVSKDYISVGNREDWVRVPLTPMAAQQLADTLDCFLPTRKIVDDVWAQAAVRLEPVPMYAFRDSSVTMWHHHLIIEGQRKGHRGLIAGIKKDVVLSKTPRPDRVAIYGWHKPDGMPIQPLYVGHVNWYVDYSHGVRLVWKRVKVHVPGGGSRWMAYSEVLRDTRLRPLLCDE